MPKAAIIALTKTINTYTAAQDALDQALDDQVVNTQKAAYLVALIADLQNQVAAAKSALKTMIQSY